MFDMGFIDDIKNIGTHALAPPDPDVLRHPAAADQLAADYLFYPRGASSARSPRRASWLSCAA
jgi:hypothetical protein